MWVLILLHSICFLAQAEVTAEQEGIYNSAKDDLLVLEGDREYCQRFIDNPNIDYLPVPEMNKYYSKSDKTKLFKKFSSHTIFQQCPAVFDKIIETRLLLSGLSKESSQMTDSSFPYSEIANSGDHYHMYDDIDINNDGNNETVILYRLYLDINSSDAFWLVDPESCALEMIYGNYVPNKIFKLDNEIYIANYSHKDRKQITPTIYVARANNSAKSVCRIETKEKVQKLCALKFYENNKNCQFYFNVSNTQGEK